MARIAPLTPLRYDLPRLNGDLSRVVSPPYDVISPTERAALAARDPHNVVHLILPEGEGDAKYRHAGELFDRWRSEGVLVRDSEPAFYRLDQTFRPPGAPAGAPSVTRRGFLALVELVPFRDRVVLPHERTLSGPKADRLALFRATRANLSPGFMLYRDPRRELDAALATGQVLAELSTPDGVAHSLARVTRPEAVRAIIDGVAASTLLIADGHHRYETALAYANEVSAAAPSAAPNGEHRYFMTFLTNGDDPALVVFPTHRHAHSIAGFSFERLLREAAATFRVAELPRGAPAHVLTEALGRAKASGPAVVAAATDGAAALLTLRGDVDLTSHPTLARQPAVLRKTDVAVLHAGLLEGVLGITPAAQAAKTNLWYPQDAAAALAELRAGRGDVLFLMNATPVVDVRDVAEAGEVMPQKSTFFHPKVPTGLALHTLDPARAVPGALPGASPG
ncbi:MAG TPA: DUF1015 domain-containing protein [Polyangiaceae bacterium]|jgi:uncharacterized protein (DUF1015 family)|nr:DUF1015 domain-containing protein [Polyangiaceae bacterium]